MARAAARENIVPSAISKRMTELEETFGVPLLERGVTGVQPTPAGRALVFHARMVLHNIDRMHEDMAGFIQGARGHIRLSASVAALSGDLPADIQSFQRAHPRIDITLEEGTTRAVFRSVIDGTSDVGIGSDFGGNEGLHLFPYGECELAAIVPVGHPLADRATLTYADLLAYEQIELNRDNGISSIFEHAAHEARQTRRVTARVGSHETVCTLVARGMGVGVVPRYLNTKIARSLTLRFIPLAGSWSRTRICVGVRDLQALPPAAQSFVAHLRSRDPGSRDPAGESNDPH